MKNIKEVKDQNLLDYSTYFEKLTYYASTQDFRGVERMYWKLKNLMRSKLPTIKID